MSENLKIPIAFFLFDQAFAALESALQSEPVMVPDKLEDAVSAINYTNENKVCLIIASINSRDNLAHLQLLIKELKKDPSKIVKIVATTRKGQTFDKALAKMGVQDFIEVNLKTKALRYKIDFWVKSLTVQSRKTSVKELKAKSLQETAENTVKKSVKDTPQWLPPLDCEGDIWLLSQPSYCRKVLNKWVVSFKGPSPYVARWVETQVSGQWQFKFSNDDNPLCSSEFKWFFKGSKKPEFIWKENLWLFASDEFELSVEAEGTRHMRMRLEGKSLSICENSDYAQTKEQLINESFDKELVFGNDADEDSSSSIDNSASVLKNLKGQGKTTKLNRDPLSGSVEANEHDSDPLSGSVDSTDKLKRGPLRGKSHTDDLSSPNLALELGEEARDTEELSAELDPELANGAEDFHDQAESRDTPELGLTPDRVRDGALAGKAATDDLTSPLLTTETSAAKRGQELEVEMETETQHESKGRQDGTDHLESYVGKGATAKTAKNANSEFESELESSATETEDLLEEGESRRTETTEEAAGRSAPAGKRKSKSIEATSNVVAIDPYKRMKTLFDRAAKQYKRG